MVKVDVVLTASKILAFFIIIIGCIGYFFLHDTAILEMAIPTSAALMGIKTFTAGYVQTKSDTTINENIEQKFQDSPDIG